jgi:hypothetical protein
MEQRKTELNKRRTEQHSTKRFHAKSLAGLGLLLAVIILAAGLILYNRIASASALKQLAGTWVYDSYTQYEFDGQGHGRMYLETTSYAYTYTVHRREVSLDFEDESVYDCTYTFTVSEDTLTLRGGEGTTGGTYELKKKE